MMIRYQRMEEETAEAKSDGHLPGAAPVRRVYPPEWTTHRAEAHESTPRACPLSPKPIGSGVKSVALAISSRAYFRDVRSEPLLEDQNAITRQVVPHS